MRLLRNLSLIATIACVHSPPPFTPTVLPADFQRVFIQCQNRIFTPLGQISCVVPTYSSSYRDSTGAWFVRLTHLEDSSAARTVLTWVLQSQHRALTPISFLKAKYSYADFARFSGLIVPSDSRHVTMVGMDETRGRLRIGYDAEDARLRILATIKKNKVPEDAVLVEFQPAAQLTGQSR